MIALVNSSAAPLRLVTSHAPQIHHQSQALTHETCLGTPSCAPLVQHELLKAVRHYLPHTYLRASRDLGLTLERTKTLVEQGTPIISAARAIKLARLVAYEPNNREVFAAAGYALYQSLHHELSRPLKFAVRQLPRSWRVRLAIATARKIAHRFAGSTTQIIIVEPNDHCLYLSLRDGLFTDRLDTFGGAHAYYRGVLTALLREFAHVQCEVAEMRRARAHLHLCNFKITWKA
jgi:hypothetical protein